MSELKIINSLPNINHEIIDISSEELKKYIEDSLRDLGITPIFKEPGTFSKNKKNKKFGFAFGISKIGSGFDKSIGNHEFAYRHQEVIDLLKKAIEKFDLLPKINWNRGFGVFVYNIWFKPVK